MKNLLQFEEKATERVKSAHHEHEPFASALTRDKQKSKKDD